MQNGQKVNIPLDSGLDVKSSDMLVPVNKPLFHHNRQKYQGRYLPSSVRFEHDGWAAGHDVYEFDVAEAQVQVDDITIIRKTLNDNPAYEVRLLDIDRNILGTLVYNAEGRIKDYSVDSCGIADGHVTGLFNNKPFDLLYDRNDINAAPVSQIPDSDIQLDEFEKLSEYASRIKLYDEKARIELTFAGMYLPSDKIYNGGYLFGKFMQYLGGVSSWQCGSYMFNITYDDVHDTYGMSLVDRNNNPVTIEPGASVTPVPDSNDVDVSFTADVTVDTGLNTIWNRWYPFFKGVDVTAPKSDFRIAQDADESRRMNRWNVSMIHKDPVVSGSALSVPDKNKGMLYFNDVTGHTDHNSKIIKHTLPVWIGISDLHVQSSLSEDAAVDNYTKTGVAAVPISGVSKSIFNYSIQSAASADARYAVKYTSEEVSRLKGSMWLASDNFVIDDNSFHNYSYFTVVLRYKYVDLDTVPDSKWNQNTDWFANADWYNDTSIVKEYSTGGDITPPTPGRWYLPIFNGKLSDYDLRSFISQFISYSGSANRVVWMDSVYILGNGSVQKYAFSDVLGRFFNMQYSNFFDYRYGCKISCSFSDFSKSAFTHTSGYAMPLNSGHYSIVFPDSTNAEPDYFACRNYIDISSDMRNCIEEVQEVHDTGVYWAACSLGCVLSELAIMDNRLLTDQLDTTNFSLVPVPDADFSNYVDDSIVNLSNMLAHDLKTATCDETLSIGIDLRSKYTGIYLYYTPVKYTSPEDTEDPEPVEVPVEVPAHIRYNTLDAALWPEQSKLKFIVLRTSFDAKDSSTADNNMQVIVYGIPAKRNKDSFFRTIAGLDDILGSSDELPGSNFYETVLPAFIVDSAFDTEFSRGWVDVQNVYASDTLYLQGSPSQDVYLYEMPESYGHKLFTYMIATDTIQSYTGQFTYGGKTFMFAAAVMDTDMNSFSLLYKIPISYAMRISMVGVPDSSMTLLKFSNNIAVINVMYEGRYLQFVFDFDMRQVTVAESFDEGATYTDYFDCDEEWFSFTGVNIIYRAIKYITCALEGVYSYSGLSNVDYAADGIHVTCGGVSLVIPYDMDTSGIGCFYTDTRWKSARLDRIQFAKLRTDAELQFLRQQWNTDNDVENFWWVDGSHVLVLTRDRFYLREKTSGLDDWDGDIFENVHMWERPDIIDSAAYKYFCASANRCTSRLIRVMYTPDGTSIDIFNPLRQEHMLDEVISVGIELVSHRITKDGASLDTPGTATLAKLNTFSDINMDVLVTHAKWSATCIDNFVIVGIHYDNNINQWAVVIDLDTGSITKVIQGYGFVGIDGSLTGGEVPSKYFDTDRGFIGTVYGIDALSQEDMQVSNIRELWDVTPRIIGDDTQQWYIDKSIDSIVSHLKYAGNGAYMAVLLTLSNNYSVDYDSASFASSVLSDTLLKAETIADAIPITNGKWKDMLKWWFNPVVYSFNPRISVMNYLQQSVGQAAYVHYNSASIWQKAQASANEKIDNSKYDIKEKNTATDVQSVRAVNNSELSFDTQSVKQEQSINDPYTTILTICGAALSSLSEWGRDSISYNADEDKLVGNNVNYSDYFEKNLNSAMLSDNGVQSVYSTQTSEVTALKTLDMFYSTCDKQHVCAGRGYVNHNFVAQCVVQSNENIKVALLQQRLTLVLRELTMLPLQIEWEVLNAVMESLSSQVDASAGIPWILIGWASGATIPASPVAAVGYAAAYVAREFVNIGKQLVDTLVTAMGGGKLQSAIAAKHTNSRRNIEHKHRYGSRSESFMWPCFGVDAPQTITDESVTVVMENKPWRLDLPTNAPRTQSAGTQPDFVTQNIPVTLRDEFKGEVPYFVAMVKGEHKDVQLPDKMAFVIGTESFLPPSNYKNRSVGESEPVFPTPPFQDYIIDESWQLAQTASDGMTTWVSCRDTKLIDGDYSNIVVSDDFCGVACPYTAIEVKRGIEKKYIRPWAVTPNAVALNNTGINCMFEEKAYHAFDGYGSRIVNWMGSPGIGKEKQTFQYAFLTNDRFKRSNKLPPNEFMGNFKSEPKIAIHGDMNDSVFSIATQPGENKGMLTGTVGEDKDVRRYALPVFSEFVNTLPAVVKTVSSQTLSIVDGVTSLTTANRDLQTAYKSPVSVDFSIGKNKYRYTYEYICSVENDDATGVTIVTELVPCLGLKFIGSTPYEAYLYSDATRQYYKFTGGTSISSVDTIERFRGVISGRYDFISQEVVLPCVATFDRLDGKVHDDDDETDNVIVPLLKDSGFIGEVPPPLDTIYNKKFRTLSLPSGVAFQGPNRCIINRFVVQDYMIDQIKSNYGKWKRVSRETYHPFREYKAKFHDVETFIADDVEVNGWTHNPFLLVTSPLGVSESVDCMFEWEITFCWPVEMDKLYDKDNYAVVNIMAETMTPGGKVIADRPVHIFLTKELFTRSNNYGYYSFRYQSKCGAGNRERLHIWSDQYICISGLQIEYQVITEKRTEMLTQQADITGLKEV